MEELKAELNDPVPVSLKLRQNAIEGKVKPAQGQNRFKQANVSRKGAEYLNSAVVDVISDRSSSGSDPFASKEIKRENLHDLCFDQGADEEGNEFFLEKKSVKKRDTLERHASAMQDEGSAVWTLFNER